MLSASKSGSGLATGYNLTRSLRLRASATAYLNRTFATPTNNKIWTLSTWIKRGVLGATYAPVFGGGSSGANYSLSWFTSTDTLTIFAYNSATSYQLTTTQVFRDPSAWYHVVIAVDTTQATAANRVKLYVNGAQVTAFNTATYPTLNYNDNINSAVAHYFAQFTPALGANYYDGYIAETNFIDGQALTPSSFGSTNALTGVWQPAAYTGSYGTNGFYLPFTDNSALTTSSNVGLGKDFSGNANYWVTNNISITAGVTYDSMTDVPTLTSATAANFGVLNPIDNNNGTISRGNLYATIPTGTGSTAFGNFAMTSGKWYWEVIADSAAVFSTMIGVADQAAAATNRSWASANGWYYYEGGQKYNNNTGTSYGASYVAGDVIGITYDAGTGSLSFYKNNVSQGVAYNTGLSGKSIIPALGNGTSSNGQAYNCNFGQRPFAYTPPTGFVALNTFNLPTSTIVKGNTVMDATLWTGNSSTQSIVNAAPFRPDLVWIKIRSAVGSHRLLDSVRGATNALASNLTQAEFVDSTGLTAFNNNGFTLGADGSYNGSGSTYVGWQWQAGQGSTSSNTNGSITSTVSVNASAGFSVVTFAASVALSPQTVGHGLGVAPSLIIVKPRSSSGGGWYTYHSAIGATQLLQLNLTSAQQTTSGPWNNTAPTSSVFTLGGSYFPDAGATTYVAYCWTPIAGFSAFGSYTGNGSTDGPFVYVGFRPKWVMIKCFGATASWVILDSSRDVYNPETNALFAESSVAEGSGYLVDFLSNGFKVRNTGSGTNSAGTGYIFAAFAENPFKNSLAR